MKPMKKAERTILIHKDANLRDELDTIEAHLDKIGAVIMKFENDGLKKMAYPINGEEKARYYFYELSMPADKFMELNAWMRLRESVLRHLLIKA